MIKKIFEKTIVIGTIETTVGYKLYHTKIEK